ncbi:hypothetical protein [Paracidovorax citrulli]|uniref:Uncharacterized protein n=2 Tax=Paracidovorax citrulli TaxID=80869 RepID=A1TIR7_PARC0|nr:hypothetical protein [Paracidovorax citrulli]ABM30855.1 hypothetical protein Aave_0248 [Paracidovorax citrulli AAC00-1]ATG95971.1 hypothetical protein CQB05_19610 [Paracidovorax citrulli]PVY65030.1 hypothetical protein C8E08_2382 [Paracidovorax citrulli]QCX10929.1 hypothetical protein APS58_2093 [Paracidovorax citrulli]REG70778.1 hypothetical protein C8E07_3992 [Paracidovorax citrulli]
MTTDNDNSAKDRSAFETSIWMLKVEMANAGAHMTIDANARLTYTRQIDAMANELRAQALSGNITWAQAAQQAQDTRNVIMEVIRGRSTPFGRAMAQQLKAEGKTLNELIARKVQQLHGPGAQFDRLTAAQQNGVYAEIVKSAGKSNPRVTQTMRGLSRAGRGLSRAGRGLIVLSLALSVYNVATAQDKVAAAGREVAVTGAGIGGGIAGGALAGLACGPGAPVCVAVGAFVGGALSAFGVDMLW